MALAEARAAWQRTANRFIAQEDAKRAPKLACCPSVVTASGQQSGIEPAGSDNTGRDNIPSSAPLRFNRTCTDLSPNSRWWLQMQPSYGYQKVLMDEQSSSSSSMEAQNGSCRDPLILEEFTGCEVSKGAGDDVYFFDSESSWIGSGGKNSTPWWRTADTEELALLVTQRSLDVLENCDLPIPHNTPVNKGMASLLAQKPGFASLIAGDSSLECAKSIEDQLALGSDSLSSMGPTDEELIVLEGDSSRAQLLEALCHSQTRAREADEVMKKARVEKEHVVKLVLRQASQLFAYEQWVHLLELENKYLQFKNVIGDQSTTSTSMPWKGLGNRRTRKGWPLNRKRAKRGRCSCDFGKYAVAFALGLGLAGLLLGWTVGWVLPVWFEI